MGAPLHPEFIHWPVAFLTLSWFLDAVQPVYTSLPVSVTSSLPALPELQRFSYYALSAGLLTSVPAILTGAVQAVKAVEKGGLYEADGTLRKKVKVIALHAIGSDIVLGLTAWTWYGRSQFEGSVVPDWTRAGIAVALGAMLTYAAHQGGRLTYEFGMGMSMGRKKTE